MLMNELLKRDYTARSHSLTILHMESYDYLSLSFILVKQKAWLVERRAKRPVWPCLTIQGIRIRENVGVYEGVESASPLSIRFDRVLDWAKHRGRVVASTNWWALRNSSHIYTNTQTFGRCIIHARRHPHRFNSDNIFSSQHDITQEFSEL